MTLDVKHPDDAADSEKGPDHHDPRKPSKEDLDRKLDKELMDTFPTSDPPALTQPTDITPAGPAPKKKKED